MTPHPLATYAQMTVSPQRYRTLRRRRRAVHLLLSSSVRVPEPTLVEQPEPQGEGLETRPPLAPT